MNIPNVFRFISWVLGVPTYTTTSSDPANWHTTISGAGGMGIVVFYNGLYAVTSAQIRGFKIGQTILVSFYSSGEQKVVFLRYTYYNGEWHDYVLL